MGRHDGGSVLSTMPRDVLNIVLRHVAHGYAYEMPATRKIVGDKVVKAPWIHEEERRETFSELIGRIKARHGK